MKKLGILIIVTSLLLLTSCTATKDKESSSVLKNNLSAKTAVGESTSPKSVQEFINVSPSGEGQNIYTLSEAIEIVTPGQTIRLQPGNYGHSHLYTNIHGTARRPITITGSDHDVVFSHGKIKPRASGGYCLQFRNISHVRFETMTLRNCWARGFIVEDAHHVSFKNFEVIGSKDAFRIKGSETQYISIEDSHWNQDPTGKLWTHIDWEEAHHTNHNFYHFNGSFFACVAIKGDVLIKNNFIENAFNGVRMWGDHDNPFGVNKNVEITGNHFLRIRDNPIEPEFSAYNWWIHHNKIENAHGWISITNVAGGLIYIFGNTGWNNEKYGRQADNPSHLRGVVLKFSEYAETGYGSYHPTLPVYVFHNSWYTEGNLIRHNTPTSYLKHFNNAIQFHEAGDNADLDLYSSYYTLKYSNYDSTYEFYNDLINKNVNEVNNFDGVNYLGDISEYWNGTLTHNTDLHLTAPETGNFIPLQNSPVINGGSHQGFSNGFHSWTNDSYQGDAPDVGAFEGTVAFQGPVYQRIE